MNPLNQKLFLEQAINNYVSGEQHSKEVIFNKPRYLTILWVSLAALVILTLLSWSSTTIIKIPVSVQKIDALDSKGNFLLQVRLPKKHSVFLKNINSITLNSKKNGLILTCSYGRSENDEKSLITQEDRENTNAAADYISGSLSCQDPLNTDSAQIISIFAADGESYVEIHDVPIFSIIAQG